MNDRYSDWTPATLVAARAGEDPPLPRRIERPGSTQEVAEVLRRADAEATPVVPFGGGSSVVGGISVADAIVVDLRDLNRLIEIDHDSLLVTVQAGIRGPELAERLAAAGFTLGHEPQSLALSTVGGWLATRACGQLSAGYGGIETMVAGLEAVLPGGRVARAKTAPRRSTGPDLVGLMLGSEGTLGIITEATLRIHPLPSERADRVVRFEHMAAGVAACRGIVQAGLRPVVVRLYDAEDAALFLRHHPQEAPGPLLILSFEGDGCDERADRAVGISGGAPGNDQLAQHWWKHRNDAVSEFRSTMAGEGLLGPHGIVDTMEVAATWSRLRDLYHSMKDSLGREAALAGCHLSHAYPDGACLYFTLAAPAEDDAAALQTNRRWWEIGMRACLDAGGTISHHHGIGRVRAPWLEEELGEWYEVLVAIKRALDPKGIMNPGVFGL